MTNNLTKQGPQFKQLDENVKRIAGQLNISMVELLQWKFKDIVKAIELI